METMIQPKVTGYRQLSEIEARQMNVVKQVAEKVGEMVEVLKADPTLDKRWLAIGETDLQKGFMAIVRSIARPTTF